MLTLEHVGKTYPNHVHALENVSLRGGPFPVLGEEHIGGERRSSATIVQLEEQLTGLARQVVE